jgi:nucleoid-associated protein YgaU
LAVTLRLLLTAGDDRLRVPLASADDLGPWIAAASPPEMAIAVLRLLAVAACAHLLVVTALGVLARTLRARALATSVARLSPAVVRRIVAGGSGAGLVLGSLVAALPAPGPAGRGSPTGAVTAAAPAPGPAAGDQPAGEPTATMARTDGPAPASATMEQIGPRPATGRPTTLPRPGVPAAAPGGSASTTRPPPVAAVSGPAPTPTGAAPGGSAPPRPAAPRPDGALAPRPPALPAAPRLPTADTGVWRVEPGDSLWSIAEDVVHAGRPDAPERSVARYWQQVVAANRARLVDPGNPDLLVPGQTLDLPPIRG